jgi:NAD(P)-dependent dehydrogenase (short-subunit alcohol dehydrogenase family)
MRTTHASTGAIPTTSGGCAASIFVAVERGLGPVTGLLLAHCEGVDSDLLGTTVESPDRHFAVNARGSWQLVREMGRRFHGPSGRGRIVALTSARGRARVRRARHHGERRRRGRRTPGG